MMSWPRSNNFSAASCQSIGLSSGCAQSLRQRDQCVGRQQGHVGGLVEAEIAPDIFAVGIRAETLDTLFQPSLLAFDPREVEVFAFAYRECQRRPEGRLTVVDERRAIAEKKAM